MQGDPQGEKVKTHGDQRSNFGVLGPGQAPARLSVIGGQGTITVIFTDAGK